MNVSELSKLLFISIERLHSILKCYGYDTTELDKCEVDKELISCLEEYVNYYPEREGLNTIDCNKVLDHLDVYNEFPKKTAIDKIFRLLSITVCIKGESETVIDLSSPFNRVNDDSRDQFSLLIGLNGVGKSTTLRELIDFFVDFNKYYEAYFNNSSKLFRKKKITEKYLQVTGVSFLSNSQIYEIKKSVEGKFFVNGSSELPQGFPFPNIVASCFGISDKFPIKNILSSSSRANKYDVPFYTYVGARASSNIFSVANTLFQMLDTILNLEKTATILKMKKVLQFIGYDAKLTLRFKVKQLNNIIDKADFLKYIQYSNNEKNNGRHQWYINKFLSKVSREQTLLYKTYMKVSQDVNVKKRFYSKDITFNEKSISSIRNEIKNLYQLRQLALISNVECVMYKNGEPISSNDISSGEFDLLCIIAGALSASETGRTLVLIDEPEISQHPNWQMQIIDLLNDALIDSECHFLIATHSHFLVSDLPKYKSSVTYLHNDEKNRLLADRIIGETYGWSAEEVLLKVFKLTTTRNIYLAELVGKLLDKIAKNDINLEEVRTNIKFLSDVLVNMSDVDPMKKIISTIVNTYKNENGSTIG